MRTAAGEVQQDRSRMWWLTGHDLKEPKLGETVEISGVTWMVINVDDPSRLGVYQMPLGRG